MFEIVHEEMYEFTPDDGSPSVCIRSGALRSFLLLRAADKVSGITFPLEPYARIVERHGIEEARMATMTEEEAHDPVIVAQWGEHHILIDGAHRRAFWALRGVSDMRGWIVPEELWREFVFDPHTMPNAWIDKSGISAPHRNKN